MQTSTPRDASAPGELEDRLIDAFWTIGRAMKNTLGGDLDRGGQWLLHIIDTHGEMRLTQLAAACDLDVSTVSRHVRQLEDRGLVARTPDPDDGRASRVAVTPAGHDALVRTRTKRRALVADRLADWSPADLETLTTLMSRLAAQIEASHTTTRKTP
ncbi:MarR family winged helix-turn-helix transcriptional regulator [Mariniluteicoccus flavus]